MDELAEASKISREFPDSLGKLLIAGLYALFSRNLYGDRTLPLHFYS